MGSVQPFFFSLYTLISQGCTERKDSAPEGAPAGSISQIAGYMYNGLI